jgi:hypothetical protein
MIENDIVRISGAVDPGYEDFRRAEFEWRWRRKNIFEGRLGRVRASTTVL